MTDPLIQNIQQRISEAGYPSIQDFAERSGIRVETVTKWIEGKSRPSKKSLGKLAAVLECSVEDFTKKGIEGSAGEEKDHTIERLQKLVELQERLIEKLEHLLAHRQ